MGIYINDHAIQVQRQPAFRQAEMKGEGIPGEETLRLTTWKVHSSSMSPEFAGEMDYV